MHRHRIEVMPRIPHSLQELAESIYESFDRFGKVDGERAFCGVYGEGTNQVAIFANTKLLKLAGSVDDCHMDGTFKARPANPKTAQLFTILGVFHGVALPVVFALMSSRTKDCYNALFEALEMHCPEIAPKTAISDYEAAIHAIIKSYFPDCKHVGCFFHFAQAILRKAKKEKVDMDNPLLRDVIRMIITLALLPVHKIKLGLELIKDFVRDNHLSCRPINSVIRYFETFWMNQVTPECFSVFGQQNRTNNFQEGFHNKINGLLHGDHPNCWELVDVFFRLFSESVTTYTSLSRGLSTAPVPRNVWLYQDIEIKKASILVGCGKLEIMSFLKTMQHRVGKRSKIPATADDCFEVELGPLDAGAPNLAEVHGVPAEFHSLLPARLNLSTYTVNNRRRLRRRCRRDNVVAGNVSPESEPSEPDSPETDSPETYSPETDSPEQLRGVQRRRLDFSTSEEDSEDELGLGRISSDDEIPLIFLRRGTGSSVSNEASTITSNGETGATHADTANADATTADTIMATPDDDITNLETITATPEDQHIELAIAAGVAEWEERLGIAEHQLGSWSDSDNESEEMLAEAWRIQITIDESAKFNAAEAKKQHKLLKASLCAARKNANPSTKKSTCLACHEERFLYTVVPCGHSVYCEQCVDHGIAPSHDTYITEDGDIQTDPMSFVPAKCPSCRAILGAVTKVFFKTNNTDMNSAVAQLVKELIQNSNIVIFSKTFCARSKEVKKMLDEEMARPDCSVIEMNLREDGEEIQDILTEMTGDKIVPRVFFKGKLIENKYLEEGGGWQDFVSKL